MKHAHYIARITGGVNGTEAKGANDVELGGNVGCLAGCSLPQATVRLQTFVLGAIGRAAATDAAARQDTDHRTRLASVSGVW